MCRAYGYALFFLSFVDSAPRSAVAFTASLATIRLHSQGRSCAITPNSQTSARFFPPPPPPRQISRFEIISPPLRSPRPPDETLGARWNHREEYVCTPLISRSFHPPRDKKKKSTNSIGVYTYYSIRTRFVSIFCRIERYVRYARYVPWRSRESRVSTLPYQPNLLNNRYPTCHR